MTSAASSSLQINESGIGGRGLVIKKNEKMKNEI